MGRYAHMEISWNGGRPEDVCPIAEKFKITYLNKFDVPENHVRYAADFFYQVASGKSYFPGEKGDLWVWGKINSTCDFEKMLDLLVPFFKELYTERRTADNLIKRISLPSDWIVAFYEPEQTQNVQIFQFIYDRDSRELKLSKFSSEKRWCWNQM